MVEYMKLIEWPQLKLTLETQHLNEWLELALSGSVVEGPPERSRRA